jgi:lipopolysaccharide transport system permease protein
MCPRLRAESLGADSLVLSVRFPTLPVAGSEARRLGEHLDGRAGGPLGGFASDAWTYREFILSSIRNDLRGRYARSRLGAAWIVLHPLTQVLMYALVLSALLSAKLPGIQNRFSYAIYLTSGILAWSLFTEVTLRCMTIFVDNANLLKKSSFPRICLPIIVAGSALVNNLLLLLSIIVIFSLLGHYPGVSMLWLGALLPVTILLALGIGLVLGTLHVFIRDIGQVVPILLQFGFWFTPIVYTRDIIPESYRAWLFLHPLFPLVTGYQNALAFREPPDLGGLLTVGVLATAVLAFAGLLLRRAMPELVDAL